MDPADHPEETCDVIPRRISCVIIIMGHARKPRCLPGRARVISTPIVRYVVTERTVMGPRVTA